MTDQTPIASIPTAWLKLLPAGYKIPLWRWFAFPATTIMLKRRGGRWLNGTLQLSADSVRFVQTKLTKSSKAAVEEWTIPLADISDINVVKGMASETLEIEYARGVVKLITVRSGDFIETLRQALPPR